MIELTFSSLVSLSSSFHRESTPTDLNKIPLTIIPADCEGLHQPVSFEHNHARLISHDQEIGKHIPFLLHEYDFRGIRGNGQDHVELRILPRHADGLLGSQAQMIVKEVRLIMNN
jgi:hypothetical protein